MEVTAMHTSFALLPIVSRILVSLGWVGFFILFFVMKTRPAQERATKREGGSVLGIALQMVAFTAVWILQRPLPSASTPLSPVEITLDVLAPVLSVASGWMGISAVRTLGKQWSYAARLVEDHSLVTEGPYQWVRHPIYSAMMGKLIAVNFAFGHWLGLVVALPFYIAGTMIRIRYEEKLLREAFGPQFDDYARRVPAFIPFLGGVSAGRA
jgi:protein-S-isoprenylcysteine O-methyltransferase Ste14